MVTELEEFGDRVELVGEIPKRGAIIPSAAWLSRFCSSNNSFGLLIGENKEDEESRFCRRRFDHCASHSAQSLRAVTFIARADFRDLTSC